MPLSPSERKRLRARAHALRPVVLVGAAGVSDAVVLEADRALDDHELIKMRLPAIDRGARARMLEQLCAALGAEPVQQVGRTCVLFRRREEDAGAAHGRRPSRGAVQR